MITGFVVISVVGVLAPAGEPEPEYAGELLDRSVLSGDWGGTRSDLAAKGLTFDLGWTQVVQGVVAGGRRRDWDYGGNLNLALNADFEKLGLGLPGWLVVRGESRYGETVNDDSGAFTPVNTRGHFPLATGVNEGIPFTITELAYTLAVGETLEFTIGKMLTAEGDPVEFAGGDGRTQFLNSNFIYNVVTSKTAPYSTLGAAADWTPAEWITLSSALFETTDSSTTSGFDHWEDGWTWWGQAAASYRLGGLPGGANAGFQYAFGNDFPKLVDGKLTLIPGGVGVETLRDSWAVFFGGWQYLWTPDEVADQIDAADGKVDLKGLGVFARLGFADEDSNPARWSISAGLGGRGVIPGRDDDSLGAGYYYTDVQNGGVFSRLGLPSSAQGIEAYYSVALTPAVALTFDMQWVDGTLEQQDPATVVGVRLDISF